MQRPASLRERAPAQLVEGRVGEMERAALAVVGDPRERLPVGGDGLADDEAGGRGRRARAIPRRVLGEEGHVRA